MNKKYSDSLFPIGIGASFVSALVAILTVGTILGYLVRDNYNFQQPGGVILLFAFFIFLVGPIFHNRKKSRFEKDKEELGKFDGIGVI